MNNKTAYTGIDLEDVDDPQITYEPDSLWTAWTDNGWLFELLSLTAGCVLMTALCLLLRLYDGQEVPRIGASMGASITLNTITAIVGAAIQACLLYPVIECLSQLKWSWLSSRQRTLHDMHTFDAASRGAVGSLVLLYKLRWKTSASIGGLLVVTAIALTPFFQQLITISPYRSPLRIDLAHASMPVVSEYISQYEPDTFITIAHINGTQTSADVNLDGTMPTGLRAAIEIGFYTQYESLPPLTPLCSTGNCTFDSYQTLAVCGQVANITDLINTSTTDDNDIYKVLQELPIVPTVSILYEPDTATGIFMNISSRMDGQQPLRFTQRSSIFANAVIIAATLPSSTGNGLSAGPNGGPLADYPPIAFEILLEWCVQNYTTVIENGIATTQVGVSTSEFTINSTSDSIGGLGGSLIANDTGQHYGFGGATNQALKTHFEKVFSGQLEDGNGDLYAENGYTQAIWESMTSADGSHQDGANLQRIMTNIANSMTNHLRSPQALRYQNGTGSNVTGIAYTETTIVIIRWHWIVGPVVFAAVAVTFVLITIAISSFRGTRPYAWKSSSLAVMTALEPNLQRRLGGLAKPSQLSSIAKRTDVQLIQTHGKLQWYVAPSTARQDMRGRDPAMMYMQQSSMGRLARPT